jgi:hypothetical protein
VAASRSSKPTKSISSRTKRGMSVAGRYALTA